MSGNILQQVWIIFKNVFGIVYTFVLDDSRLVSINLIMFITNAYVYYPGLLINILNFFSSNTGKDP